METTIPYKICTKCKEELTLNKFSKRTASRDGLKPACKKCVTISDKAYNHNNKKKRKSYWDKYKITNKDRLKQYREDNKENKNQYFEDNKDRIAKVKRIYRHNNAEKIREQSKLYKINNKDKVKEYNKRFKELNHNYGTNYYNDNKEILSKKAKRYRQTERYKLSSIISNNKRRCAIRTTDDGTISKQSLKELRDKQKDRCYSCSVPLDFKGKNKVHLDHHIPISKGGANSISNVVYLCKECNLKKSDKTPESLLLI